MMMILLVILFILIAYYCYNKYPNEINSVSTSRTEQYSNIKPIHKPNPNQLIDNTHNETDSERIDRHRINFFKFNDRINHTSHLSDPVDAINIFRKKDNNAVGKTIAEIYDNLVENKV